MTAETKKLSTKKLSTKKLSNAQLKQYRALAHKLNPVVTIGGSGLSDAVLAEISRALDDHELIKIRLAVGERDTRDALIADLCASAGCDLVQRIGHTATVLRRNPNAHPKKSNLLRNL